ncbi:MAG TPA: ketoacyl-ACP synthase III [Flavobacteriales bacterium]|nr:ketoacyl-ACP synthase III [Flavobacteriales bacterium]|tara:strand:+ start:6812 stop:7813 length:1002 start_codon:yes stop_codon:yes gene_type:complete
MLNVTKPCRIIGTGMHVPTAVASDTIEAKHGLPVGWSLEHSGVDTRHWITTETVAELGSRAAQNALDDAGVSLTDVDVMITAGGTSDQHIPSQAALTLALMKGGDQARCQAFHVDTTCLSFITAFRLASDMLQDGEIRRVLVVASEVASVGIGPANWETMTLFGDGAAAVVLEASASEKAGVVKHSHRLYTEGVRAAEIPGGCVAKWVEDYAFAPELHHFQMDGRELLRLTLKHLPSFISNFFEDTGTLWNEVSWTVPHQASKTGLGVIPKIAKVKPDQVVNILETYGNCISASIPMALHHLMTTRGLQQGESVLFIGTSAGYSIGALLYQHG